MKTILKTVLLAVVLGAWGIPCQAVDMVEVSIENMQFVPQHLKVRARTTVTWVNKERRNNHSILFEKEGLPESDRIFPGESWQRTFDKPGIYEYVCGPHREMTGTVEVEP